LAFWADVCGGASCPDFLYRRLARWARFAFLVAYLELVYAEPAVPPVEVFLVSQAAELDASVQYPFYSAVQTFLFFFG
jgi:hypothetical protein